MVALSKKLGNGLYSVPEAAFYSRIRTQTLSRWLFGSSQGDAVLYPQYGDDQGCKSVSFLDFVQALAVRSITTSPKALRIPIGKIRQAVDSAKKLYGVEYPLAMQHKVYLFNKELLIRTPDEKIVQTTGGHRGATYFAEIAEFYMRRLEFGPEGIASSYRAWGNDCDENAIIMDPKLRFGEPMFPAYGFSVNTLFNAVEAEGSVENAAKCYDVPTAAVYTAIEFFDHLSR
jgi:uncharacterized protein (DUF433 family)